MRKALAVFTALTLATIIFSSLPANVCGAGADRITPSKGKVGNVAVIHGTGLKQGAVKVKFGSSEPVPATAPSDKVAKCTIPNRQATDQNLVPVKVFVDGVEVSDDIKFEYDPAGPEPTITSFNPPSAIVGTEFSVEVTGTDFTAPHGRFPEQIVLIGPEAIWGWVDFASATNTGFTAEFSLEPTAIPGEYEIVVGFSDGSGASAKVFWIT